MSACRKEETDVHLHQKVDESQGLYSRCSSSVYVEEGGRHSEQFPLQLNNLCEREVGGRRGGL